MQEARGGQDEEGETNRRENGGWKVPFVVLSDAPNFCPKKSCRSFGLRKREKQVRERKVVVRPGGGVYGEPAERLGGVRGIQGDSQTQKIVPEKKTQRRS